MTAPLVVAQWISSQYFSTVEPDVFGAGDKMSQNSVGRGGCGRRPGIGHGGHHHGRLLEGRSGVFFVSETHVSGPDYFT